MLALYLTLVTIGLLIAGATMILTALTRRLRITRRDALIGLAYAVATPEDRPAVLARARR